MPLSPRLMRPVSRGLSSPNQISGLAAWWDSSDNATLTTSSGVVTAWADKVRGITASTDVGWAAPALAAINARQSLQFNGTQTRLTTTDAEFCSLASGADLRRLTILYVCTVPFISSRFVTSFSSTSSDNPFFGGMHHTTAASWRVSARTNTASNLTLTSAATHLLNTPYIVSCISNEDRVIGRANGAQVINSFVVRPVAITVNLFSIGALVRPSGASNFFAGQLGDVLVYSRDLPTTELQQIERWLAGRWGIALP